MTAVNPATALACVLTDELVRCGLREAVLAPGSRSAPLAMELHRASEPPRPRLRLHVRVDERSAAFLALGLAKASGVPAVAVCTSGTAAAHFHAAVIEADESCVPLIVLTADRPPELRDTGANQAIDQVRLYGGAVRWSCDVGVPESRPGQAGYWRSVACRAWALATGAAGGPPGPVHLNLPLREPLVPGAPDGELPGWPELPGDLAGRPDGAPWTRFAAGAVSGTAAAARVLELPWTERGAVVYGDGDDPATVAELAALARRAGWPVLAEPSSGARTGPAAALAGQAIVPAYPYLLDSAEFRAAHRPDVIISAGRPGLSRGQLAFLGPPSSSNKEPGPPARHIVLARPGGRWADPARSATDVAGEVRLTGKIPGDAAASGWLAAWLRAGEAARRAADALLDRGDELTEPRLARDLAAALPDGSLLWAASSLPIRDLDRHLAARDGLRVLASRGASGIDGLVSSATGAALAHQAAPGGGPAVALLGDLALVHDAAGLMLGPDEPRPDLCLVVVNNDGGGIFSTLEQAAYPAPFERVFGTPHGTGMRELAAAAGLPYVRVSSAGELAAAVLGGSGVRVAEVRTDRAAGAALRAALSRECAAAVAAAAKTARQR